MKIELYYPQARGWPELLLIAETYKERVELWGFEERLRSELRVFGETDEEVLSLQSPCFKLDSETAIMRFAIHCQGGVNCDETTMPNDRPELEAIRERIRQT